MVLESISTLLKNFLTHLQYLGILKSITHIPLSLYILCWINLSRYSVQIAYAPPKNLIWKVKDSLGD